MTEFHICPVIEGHPSSGASETGTSISSVILRQGFQFLFVISGGKRLKIDFYLPRGRDEEDFACHFAPIFIQVFLLLDVENHAFALDQAVGAASPGLGIDSKCAVVRRSHGCIGLDYVPTAAWEFCGKCSTRVGKSEFAKFGNHQRVGTPFLDGGGEPRSGIIRDVLGNLIYLRAAKALCLNASGPFQGFGNLRQRAAAEHYGEYRNNDKKLLHTN